MILTRAVENDRSLHGCRCVGPVLTVVAAMAHGRPAFQSPPDRREEAEAARARLTADSAAARSDHLALVAAFSAWSHARSKDGRQAAYQVEPPKHTR